ncbi:MAG: hypothetical protein ACHQAX_08395 [Gammaproteobacteria bacterium]
MKSLKNFTHTYLTDETLSILWGGTPDSRHGKIKRLLAQGDLLHIRRGVYCLADKKPHPFELAQYIYGPSYISLESALSYHQLIPEAVYTVTSVTSKRSKEFSTPLGMFSFQHVPPDYLLTEVTLVNEGGDAFFMAKPWKAICDYVFCYKKEWDSIVPLCDSLRIEPESLSFLREEDIVILEDYYQHSRMQRFLKGVQKDLKRMPHEY